MKATFALLAAAISCVASKPHAGAHVHQHLHQHQHARRAPNPTDVDVVPGPTVIAYVLNGDPISAAEVKEGIKNGTLVWANGAPVLNSASPTTSVASSTSTTTSSTSTWSSTTSQAAAQSSAASGGSGLTADFPSGQIDCSEFPSDYGAVAIDYLGLGGWTGVQSPGSSSGGFSNIETVTTGQCSGGSCCGEGMFCSYACPPGYQKSQWPTEQGSTGQSVGGIQCLNGKLQLTNPGLSNSLCIEGGSPVTVQVQNNLGQNVAVCRTDYPGTESETVPLNAAAGSTNPLTCPNALSYYTWEGSHTSAQYYVNPAGVSVEDGCTWGSSANPWGNFAPLNLGVGYSNGAAWLSIFQNSPTTSASLDFTIEIQGDNMSGTCKYSNGQYCGGANYNQCSSTTGCTVSISSGTATFVFSN